jgi:hypothetical protein
MSKDSDLFSFVALGSMNPRIHHPKWYEQVGLFEPEAINAALTSPTTIVSAAFAQFATNDITVRCLPERIDIQTTNREHIDRIREIGERLFDDLLDHTPVNVVALNFDFTRDFGNRATAHFASILSDAANKLELGAADGGDLVLKRKLESTSRFNRTSTIALRSTDDPQTFVLACNYNYTIRADGNWKMRGFLPEFAQKDRLDAESSLDRIASAFSKWKDA